MSKIFISYNRQSEAIASNLADDVEALGHTVWLDQELSGGQVWWDRILTTIRECDVFVLVLDLEAMGSTACKREYGYAADLGKPVLPVLVAEGVSANLLPPALSQIQFVAYRKRDRDAVLRLARAFNTIPPPKPLPDPLPLPPEVPMSYLGSLTEKVGTLSTLSYEEQSVLIVDLKRSLRSAETHDDARTLLERLRRRRDLFAAIAEEIDELLANTRKVPPSPVAAEPEFRTPAPPAAARKEPPDTPRPPTTHVPHGVSRKTRLVIASCGAAVGAILMAASIFASNVQSTQNRWLPLSLLYGGVPWGIAGAITANNRKVAAIALSIATAGLIVASVIFANLGEREALSAGLALGAGSGVILGAIIGVILKRKGWLK